MRWGVVGVGKITRNRFLPALEQVEGAILTAIVTTHPENVKDLAEKYNAKIYEKVEDLENVDVVYIATPNSMHKDQVISCAKKKIHILCEKPIALNSKEAMEMIRACEENGVVLGVANMGRFNPYNVGAKRLLEEGIVGRIGIIKASYSFVNVERDKWRYDLSLSGGGAIMDIGVHVINTLHFWRPNNKIVEIAGINEYFGYEVEQNAGAVARFDDGVIVLMDASYDTSLSVSFEIKGDKGILYVLDTLYQEYDGKVILKRENNFTLFNFYGENQYVLEIKDMEDAIRNKRSPRTDGYEALKDMTVIDAWYQSSKEKRLVRI
ncbi:MAG: glucose-fructose oxidoreductase [Dictyoglomus sp. NZ13-RE01]|nr:MAG: glucose-fructose oxidoreductase [Dictyoglomus sp. NZ13-RE01]